MTLAPGRHVEREGHLSGGDPRGGEGGSAAEASTEEALGDQLPDDAAAAAAERQPHRDLGAARAAAREQHVGEVQTCHHEHGEGEQHEHGGTGACVRVAPG
jgi:hypothetical protein